MVKDDPLPQSDHVLRYVGGKDIDRGEINGSGFLCRPTEAAPSVNWLECFVGALANQVEQVRQRARISYGATARFVRLNVGYSSEYVFNNDPNSLRIEFVLDPLIEDVVRHFPADPSHSLMQGVPKIDTPEGELIGDLLVECIVDSFPARRSK